jgi:Mg2+ and Co2+ transporter CorA
VIAEWVIGIVLVALIIGILLWFYKTIKNDWW